MYPSLSGLSKNKIAYFFDDDISLYKYSDGHPMKPFRVKITDTLIQKYGLGNHMDVFTQEDITIDDSYFTKFHSIDYVDVIKNVNPDNYEKYKDSLHMFGFSGDSPVFDGLYDYCWLSTGGSVLGASLLNDRTHQTAINWGGGLHHAKRQEASGFCYINDCVLSMYELLKKNERVLYIDIDVHHGVSL